MVDSFGRTIDYLRLSITDRCNLRCIYCMPPGGVELMSHNEILRFDEILRACRVMAGMGIQKIKVTGGEPLVRRGAAELVRSLKSLPGIGQVTMTSNGMLLEENWDSLAAAGLDALNISLNSLEEANFRRVTRSGGLGRVLSAVRRVEEAGLPLKINCVPLRGINEGDLAKLAGLAKRGGTAVRFIELMPLGPAAALRPVPADEVMALLEREYGPASPSAAKPGNGPAQYYTLPGFAGLIGLISAMSHEFCESCNRLRLTASGILRPCLSVETGLDLRLLLRNGASDGEIGEAVAELVSRKPRRRCFGAFTDSASAQNQKGMFRTGG